ncbi:hypothetical protein ACGRHY_30005 [Streptomyces sp. HK10]|uniref:hypothetical protein n=1 Tax=Streptomyces sp. HK10 TaxID=3373255 RepID=UPI003747C03A
MTVTAEQRPRMPVEALRAFLGRVLADPGAVPPTVITVGGPAADTALLLSYATAAAIAGPWGEDVPQLPEAAGADLLLDLVYRADTLRCPTGISHQGAPAVVIAPLSWAGALVPAGAADTTSTTDTEGKTL